MKKTWHRALCALMCLVMTVGLLPMGAAAQEQESVLYEELPAPYEPVAARTVTVTSDVKFAEKQENGVSTGWDDTVTETYEVPERPAAPAAARSSVSTFAIQHEEGTKYYLFTTFEDLKTLAADTYPDEVFATYNGTEPLTIAESIRIPENLNLNMWEAELIIPEGVEFATANNMGARKVTVNGVAQMGFLDVEESLTVNGELYVSSDINITQDTVVTGKENVTFASSWDGFRMQVVVASEAELLAAAADMATADNTRYILNVEESFTISQNIKLPDSGAIYVREGFVLTVAPGCTLEADCNVFLYGKLVVEGSVINNQHLSVEYDWDGRMEIAAGGDFSGKGELIVYSENLTDVSLAITGLDLNDYEIKKINDYSRFLRLRYIKGLTKLATPTNLEWGFEHDRYDGWDEENQKPIYKNVALPGAISWQPVEPTQSEVRIRVYREGETTPCQDFGWGFGSMELPEWRSVDSFCNSDPESGTYYFTVTSEGDYVNYFDSDAAVSDTWTYVKPSAKVADVGELSWNWPYADFAVPSDLTNVGGYEVEFFFSPTADGVPQQRGGTWSRHNVEDGFTSEVSDWMLQDCGVGYYYFKVRALSSDITVACNGEWSELSPAFNLKELSDKVDTSLEDVIQESGNMTEDEIRNAVQSMDTEELKSAMLADEAVADNVAALEEKVGGAAPVEVTDDAAAFDQSKVSIVGANLNNAESAEEPIKLVIDKPEKDHVLDAAYDNAVAVKFSMDLANVEDTENLAVPVKITLPIPSTINPGFLVILHYHANGEVEELMVGDKVHVFTQGGQKYASFVLTSFSDFTMTQQSETVDVPTMAMFRMYNPNDPEHFYTGSEEERDNLVEAGWNYEGVGFNFPISTGEPVYRLYDINGTKAHLFTMSAEERDALVEEGWNYEGIAFNSAGKNEVPQYRLHNPNPSSDAYHFTADIEERDFLISQGWIYQGIGWYSSWQ